MPNSARSGAGAGGPTPRDGAGGAGAGAGAGGATAIRTIMPDNQVMATPRDLERMVTRKTYTEDPYNESGGSPPLRHHANSAKELNVVLNNFKKKSMR